MNLKRCRSVLYVPTSNARALEKAGQRGADCLILDLEDGVGPEAKSSARENLLDFMAGERQAATRLIIRINSFESGLGREDLKIAAQAKPDAVLVPKINGPRDVREAVMEMEAAGADEALRLWVMMETPLAMLSALNIASCAGDKGSPLEALVIGTNDLYARMRALPDPERTGISGLLGPCIAAARVFGLDVIDGVYNDIADEAGFAAECRQGAVFGMDGKSLIHPSQVEICNRIFSPDEAQIKWAQNIVDAFAMAENAGKGAVSIQGRMVERLHLEDAKRILGFGC